MPSLFLALLLASFPLAAGPAWAEAIGPENVARGETLFRRCVSCHAIGEGAKSKVGPVLSGVVGRRVASYPGYDYGRAIKALGETGAVWTRDALLDYLFDSKRYLRMRLNDPRARSKMAYSVGKVQDRLDLVAYLRTLSGPAGQ